ncbi:MAG: hypothetical protein GW903_07780 [Alphaproteobacteria bacterium]|nr:hypothetical protein [Alphaproteobacteria bacterium]NCQ89162.1 hypothetical protein [Alphaproteobacteria bacterium]NCT08266.1 hypothetical protein [Alphaproteobacteria bacterium]
MFGLNLSKPWQGAGDPEADKRIYCDCSGTFINRDGVLNEPLFDFLKAAKERGYDVVLVSSHPNLMQEMIEDALTQRGLAGDYFGAVQLKQNHVGHSCVFVFDDVEREQRGFKAQYALFPDDPRIARMTQQLEAGHSPSVVLRHNAA